MTKRRKQYKSNRKEITQQHIKRKKEKRENEI